MMVISRKRVVNNLISKIKRGGIIIAPRRYGKTTSAIAVLLEDNSFVISCYSDNLANSLRVEHPQIRDQIFGKSIPRDIGNNKKVIIDEFFWNENFIKINWWAAISSNPKTRGPQQYVSVLGWYKERKGSQTEGSNYEWTDSEKTWKQNGELHKIDGPARVTCTGDVFYYLKGKEISKKDFYKAWRCPVEDIPLLIGTDLEPIAQYRISKEIKI